MCTPLTLFSHAEPVDGHTSGGFGSCRQPAKLTTEDTESHRGKPSVDGYTSGGFGSLFDRKTGLDPGVVPSEKSVSPISSGAKLLRQTGA
jgi:hypothetical protein